jgi:hypothetical protein
MDATPTPLPLTLVLLSLLLLPPPLLLFLSVLVVAEVLASLVVGSIRRTLEQEAGTP